MITHRPGGGRSSLYQNHNMRLYRYIGSDSVRSSSSMESERHEVTNLQGLRDYVHSRQPRPKPGDEITFTYVVLPPGRLFLADRRSEHVSCARGEPVLTAGEITFRVMPGGIEVSDATNLSTGYCPESGSWKPLVAELNRCNVPGIGGFTHSFEFRHCPSCGMICVIKDDLYACPGCDRPLSSVWNCQV